ncbi:hypothetical protein PPERSA_04393 [Pseudocohnilembus persalinus]|uniref:Transcription factor IIIC putative zinc-finger domain-containing protein n=1 Tax=Pseudocohnilembus persalinus TaxID=266149 RepID=A0A0V0QQJ6_PSEPJ|nr:hypothetical protein PPERSA_04393 [Pseudocohnilembus persalinus]|eukprot:KRX04578.1 hypothetical protein PPERSA_04393 [Pseudocohnilembus persalinus]
MEIEENIEQIQNQVKFNLLVDFCDQQKYIRGKLSSDTPLQIDDNNLIYLAIDNKIYILSLKKIIKEKPFVLACLEIEKLNEEQRQKDLRVVEHFYKDELTHDFNKNGQSREDQFGFIRKYDQKYGGFIYFIDSETIKNRIISTNNEYSQIKITSLKISKQGLNNLNSPTISIILNNGDSYIIEKVKNEQIQEYQIIMCLNKDTAELQQKEEVIPIRSHAHYWSYLINQDQENCSIYGIQCGCTFYAFISKPSRHYQKLLCKIDLPDRIEGREIVIQTNFFQEQKVFYIYILHKIGSIYCIKLQLKDLKGSLSQNNLEIQQFYLQNKENVSHMYLCKYSKLLFLSNQDKIWAFDQQNEKTFDILNYEQMCQTVNIIETQPEIFFISNNFSLIYRFELKQCQNQENNIELKNLKKAQLSHMHQLQGFLFTENNAAAVAVGVESYEDQKNLNLQVLNLDSDLNTDILQILVNSLSEKIREKDGIILQGQEKKLQEIKDQKSEYSVDVNEIYGNKKSQFQQEKCPYCDQKINEFQQYCTQQNSSELQQNKVNNEMENEDNYELIQRQLKQKEISDQNKLQTDHNEKQNNVQNKQNKEDKSQQQQQQEKTDMQHIIPRCRLTMMVIEDQNLIQCNVCKETFIDTNRSYQFDSKDLLMINNSCIICGGFCSPVL